MRGRKPQPTVLRMLRGNPGRRPVDPNEPQPPPMAADCPPELTDAEAQAEWARTIAPAVQWGQITASDRAFAIAHCELWATWRSQVLEAAKHAHVVSVDGKPTPNPARQMANKTLLLLAKVDIELGLTPSSRTRVRVERPAPGVPKAEPNKWAGLLK